MRLEVNIDKRHLVVLLIGMFVVSASFLVYAQTSGVSQAGMK